MPKTMKEIEELIPSLSDSEYNELCKSIEVEGVRDAGVVWKEKDVIIDGHHRFKAAEKFKKEMRFVELSFPDIKAVKEWMYRNQLGRRNLTPNQMSYYRGLYYNSLKITDNKEKAKGGGSTAQKVAEETGVSERTIGRDGNMATAIDIIGDTLGKLEKKKILDGKSDINKSDVEAIGKVAKKQGLAAAAAKAKTVKAKPAKPAPSPKSSSLDTKYDVVYVEVDSAKTGFSIHNIKKPAMGGSCAVYFQVADEYLLDAVALIKKWDLEYDASFILQLPKDDEGVFSRIKHSFLLMATKGTVAGPHEGKEFCSLPDGKDPFALAERIMNSYHPKGNKIAVMSSNKPPQGWSV